MAFFIFAMYPAISRLLVCSIQTEKMPFKSKRMLITDFFNGFLKIMFSE
jgi:hypothetical protein